MDVKVFVISVAGVPLMPTTPRKARKLLKAGKAEIYQKRPFAIRLLYKTGGATQPLEMGVDTGSQHIGIGICRKEGDNSVAIYASEIELRDSMSKRKLMETRKEYRRGRRYRKTRYRKPKFRHHTKRVYVDKKIQRKSTKHMTHWKKETIFFTTNRHEGWLPPSIESKVQHHKKWIDRYMRVLPAGTMLTIEVARFDMARMKDPTVHGELYQRGPQYDYENAKAYVFDRDGYTCQCCKCKGGTRRKDGSVVKLIAHHLLLKAEGATDNPEYLITVCTQCHTTANHQPGGILYEWYKKGKKAKRGLRDATLMNIIRKRLVAAYPGAMFSYGNITAADRERFLMPKGHAADAIVVASHTAESLDCNCYVVFFKQVRSKKRSLHEAKPRKGSKEKNVAAKRNSKNTRRAKGFTIYDTVDYNGRRGWISGFSSGGDSAYVLDGNWQYIKSETSLNKLTTSKLIRRGGNNNWIMQKIEPMAVLSSPT